MAETKTSAGKIPIFCINLERRPDRWEQFINQEGIRGLDGGKDSVKRWNAVDGNTIDIMTDNRVSFRVKRNIMKNLRRAWEDIHTKGAMGCYLSHVGIWDWLVKSNTHACIVLEDDCTVPPDFGKKIRSLWEESAIIQNNRYDICILHRRCGEVDKEKSEQGDDKIEIMKTFHNTTAYIITRDCAKRLLNHVFPIQVHVDRYMSMFQVVFGLRIYRVRETWLNITTTGSKSDISDIGCDFCNIPSDFKLTHIEMTNTDFVIGRFAQVGIIIAFGLWLSRKMY